jgi:hypothetical protein
MATLYSNVDATESGLVLIESIVVAPAVASVTFSAIPQTYKHLRMTCLVKTTDTTGVYGWVPLHAQINGFTGSGYTKVEHWFGQTEGSSYLESTSWYLAAAANSASGMPAAEFSAMEIQFPNYTVTDHYKTYIQSNSSIKGTLGRYAGAGGGRLSQTTAITSISIYPASSTLIAGCRFDLYGIK